MRSEMYGKHLHGQLITGVGQGKRFTQLEWAQGLLAGFAARDLGSRDPLGLYLRLSNSSGRPRGAYGARRSPTRTRTRGRSAT